MNFGLTTHTIVKNEENFIKFVISAVIDCVDKMLVWDTGSTDKTVKIINSLKNKKIKFQQCGEVSREELVVLRNEQIKQTKTSWFFLLDGDEIWPKKNLAKMIKTMKEARKETIALVNKTRNSIADIYHYLPEESGRYKIGKWRGHLNIRAIRNLAGMKVIGSYPLETYTYNEKPLQNLTERLEFVDTWYLHTTHLKRSAWSHQIKVMDRIKKYKFWGKRLKIKAGQLPEVLSTKPRNKIF